MQSLRQIGAGILLAIVSVVIVMGGLALALAEGGMTPTISPTDTPTENTQPGEIISISPTLPLLTFTDTPQGPSPTVTASLTPPPTLINCPPPAGWLPIIIQSYDTLDSLAQTYGVTVELLRINNCLLNDQLIANAILYVPPQPTSTLRPCGAPSNWVSYTVVAGDTLYRISLLYRVSVSELMQANCLNTSVIRAGQNLRVPNVPTSTAPASTYTPIPTPTATEPVTIPPTGTTTLTPSLPTTAPTGTTTESPPTTTEIPSPTTAPSVTPVPSATSTSASET